MILEHPSCTKNIVYMKNTDGETAEIVAEERGYHGQGSTYLICGACNGTPNCINMLARHEKS